MVRQRRKSGKVKEHMMAGLQVDDRYVTSDVVDAEGRRGGIDFHDTQDENGVDDVGEKGEDADVGNTDDNDIVDYAGNESEMNEEYSDEDSMAMLETMRGKRRM